MKELLETEKAETLIHYMLKEIEHTWRIKFSDCKEFVNKEGVDQLVLIIDLKGAKLKDLTNKQVRLPSPYTFTSSSMLFSSRC